ncbi:hypothetical protein [Rhizobium sp. L9]|uniref:hypothetical protein n=1 Tax=Rhizobium sp. L9 TaxID=1340738 RepID=UPI001FE0B0DA|nr:hypothetical protein [Rhizobium sp. L9]
MAKILADVRSGGKVLDEKELRDRMDKLMASAIEEIAVLTPTAKMAATVTPPPRKRLHRTHLAGRCRIDRLGFDLRLRRCHVVCGLTVRG